MMLLVFVWLLIFALMLWLYDRLKPWYQYHKFMKARRSILLSHRNKHHEQLYRFGYTDNQIVAEMKRWDKEHGWNI